MEERRQILPSRRFLLLAGAVLLVVLLVWFATLARDGRRVDTQEADAVVSVTKQENNPTRFIETDSDNDGLLDWEEELWGTDPHLADTDGDGTPDSEEITQMKPGQSSGSAAQAASPSPASLSDADRLARDIFSSAVNVSNLGAPLSESIVANAVGGVLGNYIPERTYAIYSKENVKTSNVTLQEYGESLEDIFEKHGEEIGSGVANPEAYVTLVADRYDTILSELLKTEVPNEKNAIDMHLSLLNGFAVTLQDLDEYLNADEEDILTSVFAISSYAAHVDDLTIILNTAEDYLVSKGVFLETNGG